MAFAELVVTVVVGDLRTGVVEHADLGSGYRELYRAFLGLAQESGLVPVADAIELVVQSAETVRQGTLDDDCILEDYELGYREAATAFHPDVPARPGDGDGRIVHPEVPHPAPGHPNALIGHLLIQPHALIVDAAPVARHLADVVVLPLRHIPACEQEGLSDRLHDVREHTAGMVHRRLDMHLEAPADIRVRGGIVLPVAVHEQPAERQDVLLRQYLGLQTLWIALDPRIHGIPPLTALQLHRLIPDAIQEPHGITICSRGCRVPRTRVRGNRSRFRARMWCTRSIHRPRDRPPDRAPSTSPEALRPMTRP